MPISGSLPVHYRFTTGLKRFHCGSRSPATSVEPISKALFSKTPILASGSPQQPTHKPLGWSMNSQGNPNWPANFSANARTPKVSVA